ncbi:MAPEG family protein [Alteromonas marina]|uniref:MAPEG family protein n=1 Tax=unclassified Alteromonas TaxID=2614992 RepID=UPI0012E4BF03|nr:MAPEG family protein [Alteromonas sp. KUL150]GFD87444.1 membrane protein [Alteromonas sp. KUL150]
MSPLLTPVFLHIVWCAVLYALLTVARAPVVWGVGRSINGSNPFHTIQPKISANLSNQFEWPMFFYTACVLLIAMDEPIASVQIYLAWTFVIGRVLHSIVQIFTDNIRLRGVVFTINFIAVLAMWTLIFIRNFSW